VLNQIEFLCKALMFRHQVSFPQIMKEGNIFASTHSLFFHLR